MQDDSPFRIRAVDETVMSRVVSMGDYLWLVGYVDATRTLLAGIEVRGLEATREVAVRFLDAQPRKGFATRCHDLGSLAAMREAFGGQA